MYLTLQVVWDFFSGYKEVFSFYACSILMAKADSLDG